VLSGASVEIYVNMVSPITMVDQRLKIIPEVCYVSAVLTTLADIERGSLGLSRELA